MKSLSSNNSGKKLVLENCQKISVDEYVRTCKNRMNTGLQRANPVIDGQEISIVLANTGLTGKRMWFLCPICQKRKGTLFKHPLSEVIGCRNCLNLEYRSRLKKGMIESITMDKSGQ